MTAAGASGLEAALRRDRLVVAIALVVVIGAAWVWLALGAGMRASPPMSGLAMQEMTGMVMQRPAWSTGYAALIFAMWWVMMLAMMLPSAAPTLLLFARVSRGARAGDPGYVPTGIFAAGYLAVWGGFGVLATLLEWGLEHQALLSPMMATTSHRLGGAILAAAGLWQLTPIKGVCLRHCRSPLSFLIGKWRPGRIGAFRMGLEHGAYCLGCCWFLMGLLFFGGIMNLVWIAGLAAFVLAEKTLPMGQWVGRIAGVGAVLGGAVLLVTGGR